MATKESKQSWLTFTISITFILLYGSGFVGAKLGLPHADALAFLAVRFAISAALLLLLAFFSRAAWPHSWKEFAHISIAGSLLVGVFSIGTWESMDQGVPAAISALIIALQPLAVAIVSRFFLKKSINRMQWFGLCCGLLGVILVVAEQASFDKSYLIAVLFSVLGLVGLAGGNLYQKHFCANMNIFTGGVIQSVSSGLLCLLLAWPLHAFSIHWTGTFVFSLLWMSIMISVGAISLLYLLIQKGEAHQVGSLFYLVPGVTAAMSYYLFGTRLDGLQLTGMGIATLGVALVNIKGRGRRKQPQLT